MYMYMCIYLELHVCVREHMYMYMYILLEKCVCLSFHRGSESSSGESPEAPPMSPEVNKESSARNGGAGETRTVEGLFGDTAELSSS